MNSKNYSFLGLISGLSEACTPPFPLQAPSSEAGFLNSCTEVFVISSKAELSLVTCKNSTEAKQQCPEKKKIQSFNEMNRKYWN